MALPKISELRDLSDTDLTEEIAKVKRELFDLRFRKATRQLETGFHQFKHARRRLAQLMTVERERELEGAERERELERAEQAGQAQAIAEEE